MTDFSSLQLKVDDLKAKVEQNSITPPYLGAILDAIIELMAAIDISDRETDISTALSNSQTALSSLNALTPQVSANKSAIDALTPRIGAAEGAINAEKSERQTADAALQTALEALRTRVSTAEGGIATNADDIATLQDDLQSVASALNTLSGSGDTTAVIDTFNEVVDFLAGITNNEKLTGKLDELRNLCQDNYEDIGRLKEDVSQITQTVNEGRELQNAQADTIRTLQGGLGEAQNELGELSQMLVDYEDDAALALSEVEARLGRRIDAVGIFPFNTIVESHFSVIDGTPSYESQFPSAADGAYRHIIFDKSRGTFLWEIHAGDYPDCPAGDAYRAWKGSEEYVSEGHPRADRLYRMGNELYRWDGEALVSYGDTISAAKYATFDMQWTAAGGTVIESGKTYECNGGTGDLADAIKALSYNAGQIRADLSFMFFGQELKMLPTIIVSCNAKVDMNQAFAAFYGCKKIVLKSNTSSKIICGDVLFAFNSSFVEEIDGQLDVSRATNLHTMFSYCRTIKEVRLYGIKENIAFKEAPHISLASLQYLVANATNTKAITVTVHPDVYAKLTGDTTNTSAAALTAEELAQWQQVLADAIAKNISFATV